MEEIKKILEKKGGDGFRSVALKNKVINALDMLKPSIKGINSWDGRGQVIEYLLDFYIAQKGVKSE